jgi:hypothetical protein
MDMAVFPDVIGSNQASKIRVSDEDRRVRVDEPQQEMGIMQRSRDDINCRRVEPADAVVAASSSSCGPERVPHGTRC